MLGRWLFQIAVLIASQLSRAPDVSANEGSVFERVRETYQVDRLLAAKTIRLEEEVRSETANHDYGPDFHETSYLRHHYILDLRNQRGSRESVMESASTYFHTRRLVKDGQSTFILYGADVSIDEGEASFISRFGAPIRASDPLLAVWLIQNAETARVEEDEVWMGRLHDRVMIDFPGSPPLTILVDKRTGYITKMTRVVGETTKVFYVFDRHEVQDGIPIATEKTIYGGRQKLLYAFDNRIALDDKSDLAAFEIDMGISPEPERIDQSEESFDRITEAIFHTGQGAAYSTFVRTDEGLVGYGLARGFGTRLEAYRNNTGDTSPLRFGVVTDHHQIELAGVADAVDEGATLLITVDAEQRAREATSGLPEARIEVVRELRNIGALKIVPIATSHASKALVAFDTRDGVLTQKGHWVKWFESEPVWADISDQTLLKALEPYNLQIDSILSTDGRGLGDWTTFVAQIEKYEPIPCYRNRPICMGWR